MRYYKIVISEPTTDGTTGKVIQTYTSLTPNGQNNPAAQDIYLEVPVAPFAVPAGQAYVEISGISRDIISQSSYLTGKNCTIYAGMSKGLPLANPAQQGVICAGVVIQAYGNWVGVNQSLVLVIAGAQAVGDVPANLVHSWRKGTKLADAVKATLTAAFPNYEVRGTISPNLVLAYDDVGFFGTVAELAAYLKDMSRDIGVASGSPGAFGSGYQGVDITVQDRVFIIDDGTSPTMPKSISFLDLVGQPTWLSAFQIAFQTVMRGDLSVSDYIKMPPTLAQTTQSSQSQFRNSLIFQGSFQIDQILHAGNFRQPDGMSWTTTFTCHAAASGSA